MQVQWWYIGGTAQWRYDAGTMVSSYAKSVLFSSGFEPHFDVPSSPLTHKYILYCREPP